MTSKFITNADGESSLGDRVNSLIKNSNKLDFLVGYFFFTGFLSIYKNIKLDTPLRILVGMNIEVDTHNYIREFYLNKNKPNTDSKNAIREEYFRNMKESINKADIFDSKDFEDSYKLFKAKLENGTLEVKKAEEPNHAKMYLFYIPKENGTSGVDESKVIIGSSNLSYQGFEARNEINVYLQDSNDFEDGKRIFEELWASAKPLVDFSNKNDFYSQVLEHTWLEKIPNPYLVYIRVLYEYFKTTEEHIKTPKELTRDTTNQFFDISYQVDAIREGVAKVKKHSGCIVADVVGLGKSIIASSIAANLDKRTIIVSPPGLKQQWKEYKQDFGIRAEVITEGDLELTAKINSGKKDLLIIIDEAHNYRNEDTAKYGFLHQLCAGNKVILLSATPFNNEPDDIFSLIKLFQIPARSTIQTVNDLGKQMTDLVIKYKDLKKAHRKKKFKDLEFNQKATVLAEQIRDILDPVVIRRTRIDLEKINRYRKDLKTQNIEFSKVNPPVEQTYELGNLSDIYIETLDMLKAEEKDKGFIGARYKPLTYLKDEGAIKKYQKKFDKFDFNFQQGQKNMAEFMKQLLVRRFESSKYSFIKTLENVLKSMKLLQEWATKYKKIPIYKKGSIPTSDMLEEYTDDVESMSLFKLDDILKIEFQKEFDKGLIFVETSDLEEKFFNDLESDINLFKEFLQKWKRIKEDPKLDTIVKKLKKSLEKEKNRKIIVFTEFKDTADYLYDELKKHNLEVMEYSSAQASKANRDLLRKNFDAGYPENMQENNFKILVATDTLSEGFSLHRAGTIYNYDIPYNPTRVIQRVGRINRVNKKVFEELNIYNYFPTVTGEEISHTHEISTFKMKLFQAILGSDTQILTKDETLNGYLSKKFTEVKNELEKESWDVKYINELNRIEKEEPKLLEEAKKLPYRCRIARQKDISNIIKKDNIQDLFSVELNKGVLLFSKKGDSYRFCFAKGTNDVLMLSPQQAVALFESDREEQSKKVSEQFYSLYENAKKYSGVIKREQSRKKNAENADTKLNHLIRNSINEDDKKYLQLIKKAIGLNCIPLIYLKEIARLNIDKENIIDELKSIISENYIYALIQKNDDINNEPETILLAEEF